MPLEPVEPLDVSAPAPPACDLGSADRSDDEEAPLDAEGLLALALGELVLAPLEEPLDAEPDESLTPRAASVCRSSLPEAWSPLDC